MYVARFTADLRRQEQKNIGLLILTADEEFLYRFLGYSSLTEKKDLPEWLSEYEKEYRGAVESWMETLEKYGPKALRWVGKSGGKRFSVAFLHGEMVQELDFDALYEDMVL